MTHNHKLVKCKNCVHFRFPDEKYEKNSLGRCEALELWLDKWPLRRPPAKAYNDAYAELGGYLWYPGIERCCVKFEATKDKP